MKRLNHTAFAAILLAAGIALAVAVGRGGWGAPGQFVTIAIAISAGLLLPVQSRLQRLTENLRRLLLHNKAISAVCIGLLSFGYLLLAARMQGRDTFPKLHDEHMLLLQIKMLAGAHLWMPRHQLADFLESFHLFASPVYAPMYFPGTALLYVPLQWLHLPAQAGPLLASAAAAAILWIIIAEQMDTLAATLGFVLLLSLEKFRYLSFIVMPHTAMLLLGLMIVFAWLRWRSGGRLMWALAMGAFTGWAAITRPVDAIAYAIPVGAAVLLDFRTRGDQPRKIMLTMAAILLGAVPFLSLQLIDNHGITGHWFKTPYQQYIEINSPEINYGPGAAASSQPRTTLPQKLSYDRVFNQPEVQADSAGNQLRHWFTRKLPIIVKGTLPSPLLIALFPMGLMCGRSRRWVLPVMSVAFVALYFPFAFMLGHYPVVAAPGVIVAVLVAIETLPRCWPSGESRIRSALLLGTFASAAVPLITCLQPPGDDPLLYGTLDYVYNVLPRQVQTPAVVFVRYRSYNNPHQEVVFNIDTAWPDDAPIIKVQDLGPARDGEVIQYYARTQPNRHLYLFDRGQWDLDLIPLGTARDLAQQLPQLPAALAHPIELPPEQTWRTKLRND